VEVKPKIPRPTLKRLSLYSRELGKLLAMDKATVSSKQLGSTLSLSDAQVRKDLAFLGQFGHPGVGYSVTILHATLLRTLGLDRKWEAALVGAGNIGRALLAYPPFEAQQFSISAVFDVDERCIGQELDGRIVYSMDELERIVGEEGIQLGIIAVPADVAQDVTQRLIEAGVTGILNFAPRHLDVRDAVNIVSVDFTLALQQLAIEVTMGVSGSSEEDA